MRVSTTGLLIALAALAAGCFDDPAGGAHSCDACLECESCVEGPDGPTCKAASHQSQLCVGDEIHWLDSCGADEGADETCPEHSECVSTTGGEASCECTEHWEGEGCDVCPGNWDAAQDCAACETNWEGIDCETCPGNWDPDENCGECYEFYDETTDCETCLPGWFPPDCSVCHFFVDIDSVAEAPTGTSWADAFTKVRSGVDAAETESDMAGEELCEVWVAEGTYYQFVSAYDDGIILDNNIALYGGFDGTEEALEERDWLAHMTVLSGNDSADASSQVANVVRISGSAVLDGFTISDGNAFHSELGDSGQSGAGVFVSGGAPVIRNCNIARNSAYSEGAGLRTDDSDVTITGCTIAENYSEEGAPGARFSGGNPVVRESLIQLNDPSDHGQASAVLVGADCNIVFSDTVIQHNNGFVSSAELSTGGLYVYDSQITIERCVFYENDGAAGGAIRLDNSTATVESSVFDSNTASSSGVGAIDCCDGCDLTVWNCSFFNNYGYAGVVGVRTDAALNFRNSIVWQELPEAPDYQIYAFSGSDTSVTYSLVQGGFTGGGNIDADPLFVDSEHCDFHLQPASPCIDAANGYTAPEFDYDGNTRVDDPATANTGYGDPDYADMGAYEYQP